MTRSDAKPLVIVTEGLEPGPMAWLKERTRVIEAAAGDPAFAEHLSAAEAMIVRTYTRVDEALLARAPRLRVVGRGGVGLENIDVPACRRRGVEVVFTPDANTIAVAELVFGFIVRLVRPWAEFRQRVYEPAEFKRIRNTIRGRQLNELTLGILGMGRVGRRVGRTAHNGFGMRVIYNDVADVSRNVDFPAQAVDKQTLFREADVLTIHVDMRPGNRNLVGAPDLALMKPTAILLNTSRGEVLDAAALAEAIRGKRLAGTGLDVYAPEPPPADFPLLNLDNVVLTPHIASRTSTAVENMSWVVKDVMAVLESRPPQFPAPTAAADASAG